MLDFELFADQFQLLTKIKNCTIFVLMWTIIFMMYNISRLASIYRNWSVEEVNEDFLTGQ